MSKKPSVVLSLVVTALAGISPASAENFWIPSPEMGESRPKIHLEVADGGSRRLEVAFVHTGDSATGLNGSRVDVDNDEKPNVFNATRFVNGPGMLRVTNDPGPNVRTGTIFVSTRNDDFAWVAPIVTDDNAFEANGTAYLQGLSRSAKGHANIEIMNLGTQSAACSIQLRRPKGTALGAPFTVTLSALSHEVVEDAFASVATTAAGMRAEVTCDRPFYAYGTFVGATLASFRMHYPLSSPPEAVVETLNVTRNGVFFTPVAGKSALDLPLPLVPGRAYRKVTLDFDVFVREFTPIFTGLVGMTHAGGQRFNRTLYFGTFVRGTRAKTLVDLGSPIVEPALRISSVWRENTLHHVNIVYDAESATTRMIVTQGSKTIMDASGGAYNLDIADRGQPVRIVFGLAGVADNAYFPPLGWRFSNLNIKIER
jgi:hypothetical protein